MPIVLDGSGTISGISTGGITDAKALAIGGMPAGSVIQFVHGSPQDINNRYSESQGNWESTGIHVDITPTHANNKIIIGGDVVTYNDNGSFVTSFRIHNGTSLDSNQEQGLEPKNTGWHPMHFYYHQIAGTTNAMTFTLYMARTGGSGSSYVGWSSSGGGSSTYQNWHNMWAMEVAV